MHEIEINIFQYRANFVSIKINQAPAKHRPQFERFLKDFFDERHLAESFHAFCVIM